MADSRDKKLTEEETEYHFSDEDITYEAEPEEQVPPAAAAPPKAPSTNFLTNLSSKKRIGFSIVAFLILLYIVYKIVAPSGQKTNITPVAATETPAPSHEQLANAVKAAPPAPVAVPPAPVAAPPQQPMAPVTSMPQPGGTQPQQTEAAQNAMPPVMPINAPTPSYPASSPAVETGATQLNNLNNQLVSQMQADYTQKLAALSDQNKRLEDDVQKLSASVASMEVRVNQLVQLLINQQAESQQAKEASPVQSANAPSPKLPYTVQAIIPGRAWLRADNGDTLTVTEGDLIKDIGKITKIDPYDGVIEINTGRKVVSLSYGNGG